MGICFCSRVIPGYQYILDYADAYQQFLFLGGVCLQASIVMVDGSSMLNACFFATMPRSYFAARKPRERFRAMARAMHSPSGQMVNGVHMLLSLLFNLIGKARPTHMVVAWDISRETFRRDLYPDYKANRGARLPEVQGQIGLMRRVLGELGIFQSDAEGYEADDVIATLVHCFAKHDVCVYSRDADLLQVVAPSVRVWLHNKNAAEMYMEYLGITPPEHMLAETFGYNEELVERIHGLSPALLPDMKALSGDKSNNVPGLRRVGTKTATKVVKVFGSIERMYGMLDALSYENQVAEFKKHGLTVSLLDQVLDKRQDIFMYKKLTLLCRDVPLGLSLRDMRLPRFDLPPLIFSELGFNLELPRCDVQQVLF